MEQHSKRRSLLVGLGIATAALVAVKATSGAQKKHTDLNTSAEPEGDGYRLTEHIKKYYRTTII